MTSFKRKQAGMLLVALAFCLCCATPAHAETQKQPARITTYGFGAQDSLLHLFDGEFTECVLFPVSSDEIGVTVTAYASMGAKFRATWFLEMCRELPDARLGDANLYSTTVDVKELLDRETP